MQDENNQPESTNEPGNVFSPTETPQNQTPLTDQPQPVTNMAPSSSSFSAAPQNGTPIDSQLPQMQQPQQPLGPQQGQNSPVSFNQSKKKKPMKVVLLIVAILLVLGGGSAAAYFGYILPNSPDVVWGRALSNMGPAYDEVVKYGLDFQNSNGVNLNGNYSYDTKDGEYTGDITFKSYKSEFSSTATIKKDDFSAKFELMSVVKDDKKIPDLYFKLSELSNPETVLGEYGSYYSEYVGNWYVFETSSYDEELFSENAQTEYTSDDYKELLETIGVVAKEYLFTDNTDNAVIKMDEYVGAESKENQDTYHYKANINKENYKKFIEKLAESVKETKIGKAFSDQINVEDYTGRLDEYAEENSQFDVWVNRKTKLVQTIGDTDETSKTTTEIGQLYEGGDVLPFFLTVSEDNDKATSLYDMRVEYNKTNKTASLKGSWTDGLESNFTADASMSSSSEQLNLTAPDNAKSFWELLFGSYYDESYYQQDSLGVSTDINIVNPDESLGEINGIRGLIEQFLSPTRMQSNN